MGNDKCENFTAKQKKKFEREQKEKGEYEQKQKRKKYWKHP